MDDPKQGDISHWLARAREGDEEAFGRLWEHYFGHLAAVARKRLGLVALKIGDEEDVALSAFKSLYVGLGEERFPWVRNRQDLWKLLVVITKRKSLAWREHERREKRGGARLRDQAAAGATLGVLPEEVFEQLVSAEPTPAFLAELKENCQGLFDRLPADDYKRIALWTMEGYTQEEIADRLGCSRRTVIRKLDVIRELWLAEGAVERDLSRSRLKRQDGE